MGSMLLVDSLKKNKKPENKILVPYKEPAVLVVTAARNVGGGCCPRKMAATPAFHH